MFCNYRKNIQEEVINSLSKLPYEVISKLGFEGYIGVV